MAVVVVTFDLAVSMDVDDIETTFGRQRLGEVEEAGCMMAASILVGANSEHTQVYLRPVEDMRTMSQPRWKERWPSVGRD